jgi:transcription-repair coupling factor (superfamily II helicase)
LAIKTFVRRHDQQIVREAIQRELLRGGQVYYLHNEVKDIERVADDISAMVPAARVSIAHGQMRERELEQVMSDFYHQRANILVCTTIIETGIDIPNANTIIMDRADKLGLAQVHQLRGRVGRSHHQAYAYLMTPEPAMMTKDAEKRLEAIEQAEDLGAGFILATHDLEIRGAGELLGESQTGNMHSIGFGLYMELLDRAVASLKKGKIIDPELDLRSGTEINLHAPALIPDDYLPDVHMRLILYKRIANATSHDQLRELSVEMIDRFGLLPEPTKWLIRQTELKITAETLGIRRIDMGDNGGHIEFGNNTQVPAAQIIHLIQSSPTKYKMASAHQLSILDKIPDREQRFGYLEDFLGQLSASIAESKGA